ncbi:MAG TPA: hypothetical protein VFZ53_23390, partial [Polyangiaceae bacterium]
GVGDTGRLRSSDGMTWEAFGPTCEDGSHGVEFAAGRFVATDGWASTGESDDWEAIDFAPGDRLFSLYTLRAVGESFLGVSYYDCCFGEVPDAIRFRRLSSDDGLTWTLGDEERSQPPNIVLDDGNVCIAFRGVSVLSGPSCDALSVTFEGLAGQAAVGADGRYVVGGSGTSGAALIASTDGTTWTTVLRASE